MTKERDFSRVTFKVNAAGSWATLVTCDADRIDEVKKACETIARAGRVKFKYVDAEGGVLEDYGYDRRNGTYRWHEPKVASRHD